MQHLDLDKRSYLRFKWMSLLQRISSRKGGIPVDSQGRSSSISLLFRELVELV